MKIRKWFLIAAMVLLIAMAVGNCTCDDDDDDPSTGSGQADDDDDASPADDDDASPGGDDDTSDDDDSGDDDDNDDDDSSDDVWTDSTSGLMWQIAQDCCGTWDEAKSYCQNLTLAGHNDWRLPTISELRSLVRGCPTTETGGACGVTDGCLDSSCHDDVACFGCPENEGPADGCYWPPELIAPCAWFWSSSLFTDDENYAWSVYYGFGHVSTNDVNATDSMRSRCVR